MTTQATPEDAAPLRLHFNENTAGCSEVVLTALRSIRREDVATYPDSADINARVERWFGVASGWAQVTNGLDEGIQAVALAGTRDAIDGARGRAEVVIVEPAFEVYEMCADAVGADVVRIQTESDFRFPLERLMASLTPATRVVYLTDPHNPTGLGIPAGAVDAIAEAVPQAIVLVDEAYADFSGRTLIGPRLARVKNLVVGRTFAKAHGLAALRVGALVAHPATIARLRHVLLPFSVNVCAITALEAALGNRAYLDWYVAESAASRQAIYAFCRRHGFTYWPSEANFVLFRIGEGARAMAATLETRQIYVRDKSSAPGCEGCLRLTAGVLAHTHRALAAMEDLLASRTH